MAKFIDFVLDYITLSNKQIENSIIADLLTEYPIEEVNDMMETAIVSIVGYIVFVIYDNYAVDIHKLTNGKLEHFDYLSLPTDVSCDDIITLSNIKNKTQIIRKEKINKLMEK